MEAAALQKLSDEGSVSTAVHVAQLSNVLLNRLREEIVYTSLGPVLISCNPGRVTASSRHSGEGSAGAAKSTASPTTSKQHAAAVKSWVNAGTSLANAYHGSPPKQGDKNAGTNSPGTSVHGQAPAVPLFHASVMWQYFDGVQRRSAAGVRANLPPHIFGSMASAIRNAVSESCPQSLILLGERGSGKTEAHRQVMRYAATVSRALKLRQAQIVGDLLKSAPGMYMPRQLSMPVSPEQKRAIYDGLLTQQALSEYLQRQQRAGAAQLSPAKGQRLVASAAPGLSAPYKTATSPGAGSAAAGLGPAGHQSALSSLVSSGQALEQLLLDAHAVLEAFGSAGERGSRSPASTRFLHWTALQFARDGSLEGARVHAHLIDHWRVACPPHTVVVDKWKGGSSSGSSSSGGQALDGSSAQRYVSQMEHVRAVNSATSVYGAQATQTSDRHAASGEDAPVGGPPAAVDTNFRVFYLLLAGCSTGDRSVLKLRDNPVEYSFLRSYGPAACPTLYVSRSRQNAARGAARDASGGPFPGAAARYASGGGGGSETFPLPPAAAEYLKKTPWTSPPTGISLNGRRPNAESTDHSEGMGMGVSASSVYAAPANAAQVPSSLSATVLAEEWAGLQTALQRLQLGPSAQSALWRLLSAILLLGEVQFSAREVPAPPSGTNAHSHAHNTAQPQGQGQAASSGSASTAPKPVYMRTATVVANADVLWAAATLLGVAPERLATCLTTAPANMRGVSGPLGGIDSNAPTLPISPAKASLVRDVLACTLYRRLWSHLVAHINVVLADASTVTRAARDESIGRLMASAQESIARLSLSRTGYAAEHRGGLAGLADAVGHEREYVARVTRALAVLPVPGGSPAPFTSSNGNVGEGNASAVVIVVDGPGLGGIVGDGLAGKSGMAGQSALIAAMERQGMGAGTGANGSGGGRGSLEYLAANTGPVPVSSYAGPASFSHLLLGFAAEALEGLYQRHSFMQPAEQSIREGIPHPYLVSLTDGLRSAVDTMLLRTQAGASALMTGRSGTPSSAGPTGAIRASPPASSIDGVVSMGGMGVEGGGTPIAVGDKAGLVRPRALSPMANRGAIAALLPAELASRGNTPVPAVGAPPVPPLYGPASGLGQGQAGSGSLTLSASPTSPVRPPSLPVLPFPDSRLFLSLMSRTPGTEEILRRLGTGHGSSGAGALITSTYVSGAASIPSLSTAELLGGRPDAHSKASLLTYLNEAAGYAFPDPSTGVLGPASAATAQSLHTAAHAASGAHNHGEEAQHTACTLPSHWRVRDGQLDADALGTWLGQVQASKPGMTPGVQTALRGLCTRLPAPEAAALLGVKFNTNPVGANGHNGTPLLTGANGSIIGAASSYAGGGGSMVGMSLGLPAGLGAYLDGLGAGAAQLPTAPVLPSAQIQALASTTFALRHVHGWVAYAGEGMLLSNAACAGCEEASVLREGGRATGGLPDHLLRLFSTSSTDPLTSILMRGGSGGPAASVPGAADTIDPLTGELIADPTATSGTPGAPPLGFQDVMRPHACAACAGCIVELTSSLLTVLSSTKPTFVRCIRPCDEPTVGPSPLPGGQSPTALRGRDALSSPAVERQLRAMGALQLGLLSAYGLPVSISADLFWERFVLLDGTCLRAAGPILPGWTTFNPADPGPTKPPSIFSAMTPSSDSAFAARIRASGREGPGSAMDALANGRVLSTLSRAALTRLAETLWARYYLPSEARAAAINTAPLLKAETPLQSAIPRMFRDVPVTAGLPSMQVGGSHLAEVAGFGQRSAGNAMVEAAFAIGRGSIFLSSAFYACLEAERDHHILRMDTSTIRLQTWARTMLCRLRFLYLKSCTVRIQAWWRAGCARRAFVQYKDAASTLKMFVLSKHRRAQFQRTISAAGVIQRAWRRHIMPRRIARLKYCVSALHELVRGYVIRARMERVYRSAVRIQDAVRTWRTRKVMRRKEQAAAVVIQALFRSFRSRKRHPVESSVLRSYRRDRRRILVLTRFIARWRTKQVRVHYLCLKATALLLQKWIRSRLTRFGFLRVRRSLVTLQSRWRGLLARRLVLALRRSIEQAKEDRQLQALRVAEAMGLGLVGDGTAGPRLAPPVLGPALTAKQAAAFPPSTSTLRLIDVDPAVSGIKDVYHTGAGLLHPVVQQPTGQKGVSEPQGLMGELRQGLGLPLGSQGQGGHETQDSAYAPPPTGTTPLFLTPVSPLDSAVSVPFTSWSAVFRSLCVALSGREATVASIAVGETHTLVADSQGRVYSWGWGDKGQLGQGPTAPSAVPRVLLSLSDPAHPSHPHSALSIDGTSTKAKAGLAKAIQGKNPMLLGLGRVPIIITSVVVGRDHSVALSASGLVYSWGKNGRGQLGLGHLQDTPLPTLVTEGPHKAVASIAAGDAHTVLVTQMGAVYVCGAGPATGLGRASLAGNPRIVGGKQVRAQALGADEKSLPDMLLPTVLSSLTQTAVRAVACGRGHTVVLGAAGEVYGWGINDCGQLGQAPAQVPIVTYPIPLVAREVGRSSSPEQGSTGRKGGSKVPFASIACGSKHTLLLSVTGTVWAVGQNAHGQLGTGDAKDKHALTKVKLQVSAAGEEPTDEEDPAAGGPRMVSIAAAGSTSFGILATGGGGGGYGREGGAGQLVRETKGSRLRQAASAGDRQASTAISSLGDRTVHVWGKAGVVTEAKLRTLLLKALASASHATAVKKGEGIARMGLKDVAAMVVQAITFASGDASSSAASSASALAGLSRDEVTAIAKVLQVELAAEQGLLLPTDIDEAQLPVGSSAVCLVVPTPVPRASTLAGAGGPPPPVPVSVHASGQTAMAAAWVKTVQPPPVASAAQQQQSSTSALRRSAVEDPRGAPSNRKPLAATAATPAPLAAPATTDHQGSALPIGLQGQESYRRTSMASHGLPASRVQGQGSIVGRSVTRS